MLNRLRRALDEYDRVLCELSDAKVSDEDLEKMMELVKDLEQNMWQDVQAIEDKMDKNERENKQ